MSNIIDISAKITNLLPLVRITDELVATVNNRHDNVMSMKLMIKEQANKSEEAGEEYDEFKFMGKVIEMLTGKKTSEEIKKLNLPIPEYKIVYNAIMAAATGQTLEEAEKEEKRFQ